VNNLIWMSRWVVVCRSTDAHSIDFFFRILCFYLIKLSFVGISLDIFKNLPDTVEIHLADCLVVEYDEQTTNYRLAWTSDVLRDFLCRSLCK
jgi:hypothetical protein